MIIIVIVIIIIIIVYRSDLLDFTYFGSDGIIIIVHARTHARMHACDYTINIYAYNIHIITRYMRVLRPLSLFYKRVVYNILSPTLQSPPRHVYP